MQEITTQNLKCGGCASTITKKIGALSFVKSIKINVENAIVGVDLEDKEKIIEVKEKLSQLGYPSVTETNSLGKKAKSMLSCSIGKINS